MKRPEPVLTAHLFPEVLEHLLEVLQGLSPEEWDRPTGCAEWTVHGVALHMLDVELGQLSRHRDRFTAGHIATADWDELVRLLNAKNERWVEAASGLSPRLTVDLLRHAGRQASEYFASLDPHEGGANVSWTGKQDVPVWLDIAREYTERWHHQQQVREATGRPLLDEPRYFAPVLAAFAHGLPRAYDGVDAAVGAAVAVSVTGPSGGEWFVVREGEGWELFAEVDSTPEARIEIDQYDAWRMYTRGVDLEQLRRRVTVSGDEGLAENALRAVSIIA